MIDTGSNKYYCNYQLSAGSVPLAEPLLVNSAGGKIKVTRKILGKFFNNYGISDMVTFYELPGLTTFSGIIGDDSLKDLEAIVNRKENILQIEDSIRIPIKSTISACLKYILDESIARGTKYRIDEMIGKYKRLFEPLHNSQAATTNQLM